MPLGARSGSSRRWVSCLAPLPVRPAAAEPLRAGDAPADQPRLAATAQPARAMEEVYRLFDRRCRMATALAKLEQLRARLRRFGRLRKVLKKLLAPGLEKAPVFLDERLLGARPTRWSVATVATARCRRRCTGFGRSGRSRTAGAGPAAGAARSRPRPDDQDPAQGEGGMMR